LSTRSIREDEIMLTRLRPSFGLSPKLISFAALACLVVLIALLVPARALVLSIDQVDRTSFPGATEAFTGTITNDTGMDLTAQDLFLNFSGFDATVLSFDQLLGVPNFAIPDGTTTADLTLFDAHVSLAATILGSPYLADVQLQDTLADLSNVETISISIVPEPGSVWLLIGSLAALTITWCPNRQTSLGLVRRLLCSLPPTVAVLFLGSAHAAVTPVRLFTDDVATSVWDTDFSKVGVTLQISNDGISAAEDVLVTSVTVQGGAFSGPTPLPIALGTIESQGSAILDLLITVPRTDGTRYLLTISGTYSYLGGSFGFSLNRAVAPSSVRAGQFPAQSGVLTVQDPNLVPYPPPPPPAIFLPNAETPILIPLGPPRELFPPTPNSTQLGTAAGGSTVQIAVTVDMHNTTNCLERILRGNLLSGIPPDPNAAAQSVGGVVLATCNDGISVSTDEGKPGTFTDIDLLSPVPGNPSRTSFFPQNDGGLCCDQRVVYLPTPNLFVWELLYNFVPTCATNCPPQPPPAPPATFKITQPNRLRVAWATPDAIKTNFFDAWSYVDITPDKVGVKNNEWIDFPDLAWSDKYLYVGIDHGQPTPGKVYNCCRIVARLSLADMTNFTGRVHYSWSQLEDYNGLNRSHFVQGAPGRMVLASLDNSSLMTIFIWDDEESSPGLVTGFPARVPITVVNNSYHSLAPDGTDWVNAAPHGNITGAAYREVGFGTPTPEYLFAFDAGINAGRGRPQHYVRIETLTPGFPSCCPVTANYTTVEEYDVWNPNFAFAMAALGSDPSHVTSQIGMTVAVGGGIVGSGGIGYPQNAVGFKDDFVVYQVTASDATQRVLKPVPPGVANPTCATVGCTYRFGDFFGTRFISGSGSVLFATEAYDVKLLPLPPGVTSGTCDTVGCIAIMRYVEFGRPSAPPPQ
jgi:hypothetical protein